jgi:hypothetical protein
MKEDRMMRNRWLKGVAALIFALALVTPCMAGAQRMFATPEAAVDALVDSVARQDNAELQAVLGSDYGQLISLDELSAEDRYDFLAAWAKGHRIALDNERTARLELNGGWTLPMPIIRTGKGWKFDTQAGRKEMRTRRIGRNELAAIQSMHAHRAQRAGRDPEHARLCGRAAGVRGERPGR